MRYNMFKIAALMIGATMMFSCQKADEAGVDGAQPGGTRAYGDKTPKIVTYVEINDTNPLNVGDYTLSNGKTFVDIAELFASNIHKRTVDGVVEPTLYFNDKMTNIFENGGAAKYVKPLQEKGIKVVLTVLGDWQDMGVANMNSTQTTQFAQILAHVVAKYGLDGIGFDDEYANYTSTNSTSYSEIITKLHALMPADKLITVFDWGYTGSINTAARGLIDYAYPGNFSAYTYSSPGLSQPNSHWSPMALNMGGNYTTAQLTRINDNAFNAANEGYGAIMMFNVRRTGDRTPLTVFNKIADGAFAETVSIVSGGGNRTQDWTFVSTGHTITMDDVK